LKSIVDVHKLEDILARRGYGSEDIDAFFFGNWLRKFRLALPRC
jgi:membrane dipeptidase